MENDRLIDSDLNHLREQIHGLFSPPGTIEVDSLVEHVEYLMAHYAVAAVYDSDVLAEAESICKKHEEAV